MALIFIFFSIIYTPSSSEKEKKKKTKAVDRPCQKWSAQVVPYVSLPPPPTTPTFNPFPLEREEGGPFSEEEEEKQKGKRTDLQRQHLSVMGLCLYYTTRL